MSVLFLDDILGELKTEIEDNIQGSGNYNTTPTIDRGIRTWDETTGHRPFMWFITTNVEIEELMGDTANVNIEVELHGYADVDGYGNNDKMYKLYKDIYYFLWNDYSRQITVVGGLIDEGSVSEETGESRVSINV